MKANRNRWMAFSAALLMAIPFVASSQTQVPAAINYQGRLTDTLGNPLPGGYYEITFRIWDDAASTNAGDLLWGRSFPLHVVTNGLFNILLTDAGGQINTPPTPIYNSLLDAFGAKSRYLGLTITVSNGVSLSESVQSEISPRQQLASAPFAIQAQTADQVVAGGVTGTMLQVNSVTTAKIATKAVTTTNLDDSAVTEAKIANGAVTAAKLNIDGDVHLNDHTLFLRAGTSHGLSWTSSFGGVNLDGPALFGYASGALGTTFGGDKTALTWNTNRSVAIGGDATIGGNATIEGNATIKGSMGLFGSMVDLSRFVTNQNDVPYQTPKFTAHTDGFMMYYGCSGAAFLQVWPNGRTKGLFNATVHGPGAFYYFWASAGNGRSVMWPIRKGDVFQWTLRVVNKDATAGQIGSDPENNDLFFMPIGANQGDNSITMSTNTIIPYNH